MNRKAFYAALAFVFMLSLALAAALAGCASDKSNGKSADPTTTVDPDGYGCCYQYFPPAEGQPGGFAGGTTYLLRKYCEFTFRTDISCDVCLSGKYGAPEPDQPTCASLP
jgi:hypothetical protein